MEKRAVIGVAGIVLALALGLPQALAAPPGGSTSDRTALGPAEDLPPAAGGPAAAPYGYKPLHARELALAKANANARSGGGSKPGGKGGGGGPTVSTYGDVSPSFNGVYDTAGTPPDTTGAIGPDRYLETVNTKYAIYTRTGSLLGSGTLSALTGISGGLFGYSLSDPQMIWDAKTSRFYYTAVYYDAFLSATGLAIGWSKTATPASSSDFCKYRIGSGSELPDYPKLGDSADLLMIGYNLFGDAGNTYLGSEITTVNKPPAGSACADPSLFTVGGSGTLYNADGSQAATPVPANLVDDSNGTGYVVANADVASSGPADYVSVYSVTGSATPTVSPAAKVTVPAYSVPANAPQLGTSYLLDTLDGRLEAAVAAIDGTRISVWTAHAVAHAGGGGAEERWYEIDPAATTPRDSGAVTSDSLYIWNGAVSPDRNATSGAFGSSMAMSVSSSSPATYPAIQLVVKPAGAAQSGLRNLVQATGPNVDFSCKASTPCRWGDYSGASPDPAPSATSGRVWLANQYNNAGGSTSSSSTPWRTWVFAVGPGG